MQTVLFLQEVQLHQLDKIVLVSKVETILEVQCQQFAVILRQVQEAMQQLHEVQGRQEVKICQL